VFSKVGSATRRKNDTFLLKLFLCGKKVEQEKERDAGKGIS